MSEFFFRGGVENCKKGEAGKKTRGNRGGCCFRGTRPGGRPIACGLGIGSPPLPSPHHSPPAAVPLCALVLRWGLHCPAAQGPGGPAPPQWPGSPEPKQGEFSQSLEPVESAHATSLDIMMVVVVKCDRGPSAVGGLSAHENILKKFQFRNFSLFLCCFFKKPSIATFGREVYVSETLLAEFHTILRGFVCGFVCGFFYLRLCTPGGGLCFQIFHTFFSKFLRRTRLQLMGCGDGVYWHCPTQRTSQLLLQYTVHN